MWIFVLLMQTALAATPAPDAWTPEKMRAAVAKIDAMVQPTTLTESAATWTRDARIADWAYRNSGTYREINTPEEARQRARELHDAGFNAVLLAGLHYRQAHRDPQRIAETHRNAKLAAQACHALGMKVIDHYDWTVFWAEVNDMVLAHPEWLQKDVRFGRPGRFFCLNAPGFVDDAMAYATRFQQETGIDGYMIDEINFEPGSCGCEECRQDFTRVTGYELPTFAGSPVIDNEADPLWQLWLRWRKLAVARYKAKLVLAMQKINPHVVLLTYSTAFPHPSVNATGADMFVEARTAQFPGFEGTNTVYPGYSYLVPAMGLRLALASAHNRFSWAQYPTGSPEEAQFSIFFTALTGHAPWARLNAADALRWPHWPQVTQPRQPEADVALVFSVSTRDVDPLAGYIQMTEHIGWGQALNRRGIMYHTILDQASENIDLSAFRVVILPACESLPPSLVARLARFASDGGTVIATGPVGQRDDLGFPRPKSELTDALGLRTIKYAGDIRLVKVEVTGDVPVQLTMTQQGSASATRSLTKTTTYASDYANRPGTDVIAHFADGSPAVVQSSIGQGRIIHASLLPGRATYEPKISLKMMLEPWVDPAAEDLMADLLARSPQRAALARIEGDHLIGSMFRDDAKLIVHLLNVGGSPPRTPGSPSAGRRLTDADTVPNYPPMGPVRIFVSLPGIQQATCLSPDAKEPMPLQIKPADQGAWLDLPPGAWQRYAAVVVTLAADKTSHTSARREAQP